MSAKERSRIAAKEVEEARKDGVYQEVMQAAEKAFQEGRYEEALGRYEQARAMRPYNVYPKVKIEDLRALLAKREETPASTTNEEEAKAEEPTIPVADKTQERTPSIAMPVRPSEAAQVAVRTGIPEPVPTAKEAAPAVLKAAEGLIERRYREGHAFVIERVVTVEGRVVKYKRVFHQWGQVFYFEDGLAVDERVWKARFPER